MCKIRLGEMRAGWERTYLERKAAWKDAHNYACADPVSAAHAIVRTIRHVPSSTSPSADAYGMGDRKSQERASAKSESGDTKSQVCKWRHSGSLPLFLFPLLPTRRRPPSESGLLFGTNHCSDE
jgi:hypothetical protein